MSKAAAATAVAIAIVLVISTSPSMAQVSFAFVNDLEFTIYSDGTTHVSYNVDADPAESEITTGVFGDTLENVVVQDENGFVLENQLNGNQMTVETLGASQVSIDYDAHDLIKKDGKTWHFTVDSPVKLSVIMPTNAVIVGMDTIPLNLQSVGEQSKITLPSGSTEITYVFGITGSAKTAKTAIKDARESIDTINEEGVATPGATAKIKEAEEAFDNGKYTTSANLANQAKEMAMQKQQKTLSEKNKSEPLSLLVGSVLSGAAAIAVGIMVYKKRRIKKTSLQKKSDEKQISLDEKLTHTGEDDATTATTAAVESQEVKTSETPSTPNEKLDKQKIFQLRPQLREEDREVVSFIFDKGGSALESELRKKFVVPRTTMWRAVKRLEREGIVKIEKKNQQNLVRLRDDIGDTQDQ